MKQCYVAKLNLEPNILDIYKYETQKDVVLNKIIPQALEVVFGEPDECKGYYYYQESEGLELETIITKVKAIVKLANKLFTMLEDVNYNYHQGHGINYSRDFMELRKKLSEKISEIEKEHPSMLAAYTLKLVKNLDFEEYGPVKMGLRYIQKAYKLEMYLDSHISPMSNLRFYYDPKNEYIYIDKADVDGGFSNIREIVLSYIESIEKQINAIIKRHNIGKVSILPVYESFELEGSYKEITVEIVYPNGNPSRDRMQAVKAAKTQIKYSASENNKILASKIAEVHCDDAKNGYVQSVKNGKGKNLIVSNFKESELDL